MDLSTHRDASRSSPPAASCIPRPMKCRAAFLGFSNRSSIPSKPVWANKLIQGKIAHVYMEHRSFDKHFTWTVQGEWGINFPEGKCSLFQNRYGVASSASPTFLWVSLCLKPSGLWYPSHWIWGQSCQQHRRERSEKASIGNDTSTVLVDWWKKHITIGKWYWWGPWKAVDLLPAFLWSAYAHVYLWLTLLPGKQKEFSAVCRSLVPFHHYEDAGNGSKD